MNAHIEIRIRCQSDDGKFEEHARVAVLHFGDNPRLVASELQKQAPGVLDAVIGFFGDPNEPPDTKRGWAFGGVAN